MLPALHSRLYGKAQSQLCTSVQRGEARGQPALHCLQLHPKLGKATTDQEKIPKEKVAVQLGIFASLNHVSRLLFSR
jgi:hypothetical protein